MGLDMYLRRRIFLNNYPKKSSVTVTAYGRSEDSEAETFTLEGTTSIVQDGMYWRKANAIHQWFVDNVQEGEDNCRAYEVSFDQLLELKDTCKKVLDCPALASDILAPQGGFFFGSTEVDECYFNDLKDTVSFIEEEEERREKEFPKGDGIWGVYYEYQSSW